MKQTLTSTELGMLLGMHRTAVPRWCRARGVTPLRRSRVGRSTVTVWSIAALGAAARQEGEGS